MKRILLLIVPIVLCGCSLIPSGLTEQASTSTVVQSVIQKGMDSIGYMNMTGSETGVTDFKKLPAPEVGYTLTLNKQIQFSCHLDSDKTSLALEATAHDSESNYSGIADLIVGKNTSFLPRETVVQMLKDTKINNESTGKLAVTFPYTLSIKKNNGNVTASMLVQLSPQ